MGERCTRRFRSRTAAPRRPARPPPPSPDPRMLRVLAPFCLFSAPLLAQICQTQPMAWPDPQQDGRVGYSLARHGDTLAAGGLLVDLGAPTGAGAVYVWRQSNGVWSL